MSTRSVPLTFIQTREPNKLIKINFISFFKGSTYRNIYIYNLVDYFSRHIYLHPTTGAGINNIILLFNHYLQANLKHYAVYMDADLYFTSQKLHT